MANEDKTPLLDRSGTINPYQASGLGDGDASPRHSANATAPRDFRLRFSWSDRHRFLRVVGLVRLVAIAGGLMGVYGILSYLWVITWTWQYERADGLERCHFTCSGSRSA